MCGRMHLRWRFKARHVRDKVSSHLIANTLADLIGRLVSKSYSAGPNRDGHLGRRLADIELVRSWSLRQPPTLSCQDSLQLG